MNIFTRLTLFALVSVLVFYTHSNVSADEDFVIDDDVLKRSESLRQNALSSPLAYEIVESLTTEVGPRLAGSEAEERARDWGLKLGNSLDFDAVRVEEFSMLYWDRGDLTIRLSEPFEQDLYGTALGGSGLAEKIDAPLVYFRNLAALEAAKEGSLTGKIAFIDGDFLVKSQTGAGYSAANQKRRIGWQYAEQAGAEALVIRSVGSDSRRFPHTGMMSSKEGEWAKIPVIAVSNPDADHLRRLHNLDKTISLQISSGAQWLGEVTSGNVILDLIGREKPEEIVLIGGHLDSWDLGTGAVDDGAGVAITTAAANLIAQLPQRPRRTIRVVMFGAEEVGLLGARAYAEKHADTLKQHVLATESDFGARSVWQFVSNVNPDANAAIDAISEVLAPLGIVRGGSDIAGGGPDIIPLVQQGVPTVRLNQNGSDYFDLHHTPDDTLDKIDPDELAQNVAAYAVMVYLAAELDVEFRPESTPSE